MLFSLLSGSIFLLVSTSALAAPALPTTSSPTSIREMHTALCVAALDVSTRELAEQVKAGRNELRALMASRLNSGAAFVGSAYLAGDGNEGRSTALLDSALEAQKGLPAPQMEMRQAACDAEGARLLAGASALERAVFSRVAAKRMKRLLAE
jgi:hypothetical protein